jgi:hypothetical protein
MLPDLQRILTMPLTETQTFLLSAASQRDDLLVPLPDTLKGGATHKVVGGLLAKGLAEECAVSRDAPAWRQDDAGQLISLRITRAGLAAIGLDEPDEGPSTADGRTEVAGEAPEAIDISPASVPGGGGVAGSNRPRAGSKQGQLIAILSKEEGASIGEIATALGWLPHTTRAALTGLRHTGYEIGRETGNERGSLYRIIAMPITIPAVTPAVQAEAA